ncbi:MAG: hypothetical protein A2275_13480 [Bacteroidetes bacterium RIFOXYA12_FULL_35_11]|nr:MAG: hypothetical protein A2X01_20425 [Bacteroidetes bacterium GWF2_35_48]OFY81679.1 MAG: hypothetical protein A2275_13480 [Bacteroidetes bacterium RIFOXYA12_FULL_35_11]OFY93667.1 MAG: hypothetical protein A2491_00870 [Bacteroidetes bacterium RIFOXYC12_FULL_35_7]OFY96381.1 MAG: hypothetical protein A2309_01975 [Bacteroidetes bacterium RIFOXYB2_FULL_35_7]HBX50253.1 hypothetical protein [Bacteroidales bacterium]
MLKRMLYLSLMIVFTFNSLSAQKNEVEYKRLTEREKGIYYFNESLYSGSCFENYPNGQKGMEGAFKNGKRDGVWTWYYENGAKKRETVYCEGKIQGVSKIWYKNGNERFK